MEGITLVVFALLLGVIPGAIAQHKGHNFVVWWLFGAMLFIVALPASFIVKPAGQPTGHPFTGHRGDQPSSKRLPEA